MTPRLRHTRARPELFGLEARYAPAVLSDNLSAATDTTEAATGDTWLASSFSTGPSAYRLTNVTLLLKQAAAGAAVVSIDTDDANNPGTVVGTLTAPATYSSTLAPTAFTSSGLALAANTTYWVVLKAPSGEYDWAFTDSNTGSGTGFQHTFGSTTDAGAD